MGAAAANAEAAEAAEVEGSHEASAEARTEEEEGGESTVTVGQR